MEQHTKSGMRRWLEVFGALLLVYGAFSQRHLLGRAFGTIKHAHTAPLLVCFGLTWLLFLWGALGYKLLLKKPIRLRDIMLTQLAAAGPGRVIPGGAGQLSFGTLFLRNKGLSLPQAFSVAVANNVSGLIVNTIVLVVIFATKPELLRSLHISSTSALLVLGAVSVIFALVAIARRNKRFKKGTTSTAKELKTICKGLVKQPQKIIFLIAVMMATIFTNSAMLHFAAQAVGLHLPLIRAVVVMSTGVALGGLLPTPGGVGGVEAGLIASMYALGYPVELATSASLLYRFTTYAEPFIPGIFAYVYLRRRNLL